MHSQQQLHPTVSLSLIRVFFFHIFLLFCFSCELPHNKYSKMKSYSMLMISRWMHARMWGGSDEINAFGTREKEIEWQTSSFVCVHTHRRHPRPDDDDGGDGGERKYYCWLFFNDWRSQNKTKRMEHMYLMQRVFFVFISFSPESRGSLNSTTNQHRSVGPQTLG